MMCSETSLTLFHARERQASCPTTALAANDPIRFLTPRQGLTDYTRSLQ